MLRPDPLDTNRLSPPGRSDGPKPPLERHLAMASERCSKKTTAEAAREYAMAVLHATPDYVLVRWFRLVARMAKNPGWRWFQPANLFGWIALRTASKQ